MRIFLLYFLIFFFTSLPFLSQDFSAVDNLINNAISEKITPGATFLIGNDKTDLFSNSYGNFTFDLSSPKVDVNSIFDLASLTKVFSTTLCIMKLYEDKKLDLEDYVVKYIPEFGANGKSDIKIRNLLLHNSGLPAYYTPSPEQTPEKIISSIYNLNKAYETNTEYLYSCLNFVTLMKVVESVTGKLMYDYYKEVIVKPLNLKNTYFIPADSIKHRILPTTPELQGVVHDPLARGLKGLSGNAGLYSTVNDLALIARMMLNKGTINGVKIFNPETVALFTQQWDSTSSRALGWDTNKFLNSSAGVYFSPETYGHTGYTGTSIWIDPKSNLFVVFLTNRVYPDDKAVISDVRIKVHNFAFMKYNNIPTQPIISFWGIEEGQLTLKYDLNNSLIDIDQSELFVTVSDSVVYHKALDSKITELKINSFTINSESVYEAKIVNILKDNKSPFSDIYATKGLKPDLLFVDACKTESTEKKPLNMVAKNFYTVLPKNISYECCDVNYFVDNVDIENYKYVIFAAGEFSALSFIDQKFERKLSNYINNGGKVFFSGSEFGWYLSRDVSESNLKNIFENLFRSEYVKDNSLSNEIIADSLGLFKDLNFEFGNNLALYRTKSTDVIKPISDSHPLLYYGTGGCAAINYNMNKGKVVYFSFPFETIVEKEAKTEVINRIFNYFDASN